MLEFDECDHVFFRVTPMTKVGRTIKSKKLTLGPYQIALPPSLLNIHNIFYIREDLTFEACLMQIEDQRVKKLRGKEINLIKVVWSNVTRDITWELEDKMQEQHPQLFPSGKMSCVAQSNRPKR
ncbi:hypothetical protein CR513_56446, partial [Mucuna pruriens]